MTVNDAMNIREKGFGFVRNSDKYSFRQAHKITRTIRSEASLHSGHGTTKTGIISSLAPKALHFIQIHLGLIVFLDRIRKLWDMNLWELYFQYPYLSFTLETGHSNYCAFRMIYYRILAVREYKYIMGRYVL